MNYFEASYLAKERYKELIGETPKPGMDFFRPNLKRALANVFYSLAAKLEPKQYPKQTLARK